LVPASSGYGRALNAVGIAGDEMKFFVFDETLTVDQLGTLQAEIAAPGA
jgi:hypothetical protein